MKTLVNVLAVKRSIHTVRKSVSSDKKRYRPYTKICVSHLFSLLKWNLFTQSKSFHCGSCDKDFNTANKYEQHVAEHVSCGLDGCTFKAHPMLVEKHIAMQHRNGLYNRIVKGNSPEEIQKWILDRKKQV